VIFWLGFGFFVGYGVGSHLATRRAIRGNDETSARIVARTDWSAFDAVPDRFRRYVYTASDDRGVAYPPPGWNDAREASE
jgi:hypothetical protein